MSICTVLGLLMFPLAIYILWRIERDQADAVLSNIQREIRNLSASEHR